MSISQDEISEVLALSRAGKELMATWIEEFPSFSTMWRQHLADWEEESAGAYNDIAVFARWIDEALFDRRDIEKVKQAFLLFDRLFVEGREPTRNLIGIGLIEDLQNITSGRINGHAAVITLLTPLLVQVWDEIERQWAGHTSIMDVLRSEAKNQQPRRTWRNCSVCLRKCDLVPTW